MSRRTASRFSAKQRHRPLLAGSGEQALPDGVRRLIASTRVKIWSLRPTMSLGLAAPRADIRPPR
jgi:hypothetical protein